MTKRDFFRLIIKIYGLYSLILSLFTFLPQNISNVVFYKDEIWVRLVIITSVFLMLTLFYILLFKTDYIIDKLDLDKGFDDDVIILGDFKNEQLLKLAILLIGGFLIVDYFPNFIFEAVNIFKMKATNYAILGTKIDYFNFSVSIVNVILGLLFITNYKTISNFLNKK
ncbi:hypothetical protein FIA58_014470 [Flavobacterium jejuense]|uniref:Uncharacterized protein n=1 Tax=Flavobacterium jejuense TaxID=1544455 RepID=A0ABX0ITM5_9FLAO|nr:hypothetical protein [Flavobacterium jejuense]NHN26886.1 hypothetical protein [Flavobacterium jejuense]